MKDAVIGKRNEPERSFRNYRVYTAMGCLQIGVMIAAKWLIYPVDIVVASVAGFFALCFGVALLYAHAAISRGISQIKPLEQNPEADKKYRRKRILVILAIIFCLQLMAMPVIWAQVIIGMMVFLFVGLWALWRIPGYPAWREAYAKSPNRAL